MCIAVDVRAVYARVNCRYVGLRVDLRSVFDSVKNATRSHFLRVMGPSLAKLVPQTM